MAKKKQKTGIGKNMALVLTSGWALTIVVFYLALMGPFFNQLFETDSAASTSPQIITQVQCRNDRMSITVPPQTNTYTAEFRSPEDTLDSKRLSPHPDAPADVSFQRIRLQGGTQFLLIDVFTQSDAPSYRGICLTFRFVRIFWLLSFAALLGSWGPSLFLSNKLGLAMFVAPGIFSTLSLAATSRLFFSGSTSLLMMLGYVALIVITFSAVEWKRRQPPAK